MSNNKIKELIGFIVFSLINICIAYLITLFLGVPNKILFKSLSASSYIITYEVIIFLVLSLIEAYIYDYKIKKK